MEINELMIKEEKELTETQARFVMIHNNILNAGAMITSSVISLSKNLKVMRDEKLYLEANCETLVVPTQAEDIVQEGKDNKNCVASYLGRVKDGKSIICFVRHTKNLLKSFYALDLNSKTLKIVQCRGYNNGTTKEETQVQNFVNTWRNKWF